MINIFNPHPHHNYDHHGFNLFARTRKVSCWGNPGGSQDIQVAIQRCSTLHFHNDGGDDDDDDEDDDDDDVVVVEGQNEGQRVLWESERILKV